MKLRRCFLLAFTILLMHGTSQADPVVHKFEIWGKVTDSQKIDLYTGWGDGFFLARGLREVDLANCLETMTTTQAIAMIDKHYKDHPELWGHPLGEQILNAVTVNHGPCEGKNPFNKAP